MLVHRCFHHIAHQTASLETSVMDSREVSFPFRSTVFFKFQVMAYWDEVEISNPLGSRVKIHKLGKFNLCNIYSSQLFIQVCSILLLAILISSLKAIYLLAVVKSKYLAEYGFERLLKPFITDMNQLAVCVYCKTHISIIFTDRPMVFMLIYVDKQSTSRDLYSCSWLIQWQHIRLVGLKLALDLLYTTVDTVWQLLIKCKPM